MAKIGKINLKKVPKIEAQARAKSAKVAVLKCKNNKSGLPKKKDKNALESVIEEAVESYPFWKG